MTIDTTDQSGALALFKLVAGYPAATLDLTSLPEPWDELCRAVLTAQDPTGRMAAFQAALAGRPDAATILRALQAQHPNAPPNESAVIVRLTDVASRAVRWLWPGRLPLGKLTVLDGDPGLGKSALTLDLAARVSAGRPMPDGVRELGGPRGVVLLSAEDGLEDTIRPRLEAASADLARVIALTSVVGQARRLTTRLPTLSDLKPIREAVAAVDAALVVVDPIMAFLPSGVDGSNDAQIRSVLAPLAVLANKVGAAVLVVRHLTKSGRANPLYRGGGSIGIIGGARSGLLAARDPRDPAGTRRVLASTKVNLAAPPPSLAYRVEAAPNGSIRILWEGPTDHTATSLLDDLSARDQRGALAEAREVLRQLLADGPKPVPAIQAEARQAGINERTLRRAREALGIVPRKGGFRGGWLWELPPAPTDPRPAADAS